MRSASTSTRCPNTMPADHPVPEFPDPDFLEIAGRPTVRVERHYPHPIDKVWTAVTDPQHLGQWFPTPVEVDLRPGGAMRFTAFEGEAKAEHGATGRVDDVDAPRRLSFLWGDDRLTFDLTSHEGGTTFALTHSFDDRYGGPSSPRVGRYASAGCAACSPVSPSCRRAAASNGTRLSCTTFGLDAPEVTRTDSGWTLRIERQLTCPAEVAWNLWMGTDQVTGEQRSAPDVG